MGMMAQTRENMGHGAPFGEPTSPKLSLLHLNVFNKLSTLPKALGLLPVALR